jgi:hypothetical protein
MMVFYHKNTGEIIGASAGRKHSPEEKKLWIGDPEEIDRIVIEWKKEGDSFVPDHEQGDLFSSLEKDISQIYAYKVDTHTKTLTIKSGSIMI